MAAKVQSGSKVGIGIVLPLRMVDNDFESATGKRLVRSSLESILSIEAASRDGKLRGEIPHNPRIGCHLSRLVHKRVRWLEEDIAKVYVLDAVQNQDPRIALQVDRTEMKESSGGNEQRVMVHWDVDKQYSGEGINDFEPLETEHAK